MKKIFLISCFILLSCAAKKSDITTAAVTSECPKNATCKVELFKNKGMVVKNDEWGKTYYSLEDNATKNTLRYTYSKVVKGDIQDGGYREEVVFEMDKNGSIPPLTDEALQNTKMLFGRFCFCKGQTGYYKISKGSLATAKASGGETIALNFEISEVPQIIKNISLHIK